MRDEGGVRTLYDSHGNALISSKKDWFGVSRWDVNEQNLDRYKQRLEDVASGQSKPQQVVSGKAPDAVLPNENTPRLPGVDYNIRNTGTTNTTNSRSNATPGAAPTLTKQQLVEQTADIIVNGLRAQGLPSADRNTLITAKDLRTLLQPGSDGNAQKVLQGIVSRSTPVTQTTARTQANTTKMPANRTEIDIDWPQGKAWNPDSAPVNRSFYETLQRTFAQPEEKPAPTTTGQTRTQADSTSQNNTVHNFDIGGVTYGFNPSLRITPDMEYRPSAQTLSLINSLNSGNVEFGKTPIGDATLFQRPSITYSMASTKIAFSPASPRTTMVSLNRGARFQG